MNAKLLRPIPKERLRLVRGEGTTPPTTGDVGDPDHCYTISDGRQVTTVYFLNIEEASEWEAEAYDSEIEPVEDACNTYATALFALLDCLTATSLLDQQHEMQASLEDARFFAERGEGRLALENLCQDLRRWNFLLTAKHRRLIAFLAGHHGLPVLQ